MKGEQLSPEKPNERQKRRRGILRLAVGQLQSALAGNCQEFFTNRQQSLSTVRRQACYTAVALWINGLLIETSGSRMVRKPQNRITMKVVTTAEAGKPAHALRIATAKAQASEKTAQAAKEKAELAKIRFKVARRAYKKAKKAAKRAVRKAKGTR